MSACNTADQSRNCDQRNGPHAHFCSAASKMRLCLRWVINGPDGLEIQLPLCTRKRTQVGSGHVRKVPTRDSCTAENRISIRSPRFQHGDRFIDATDQFIGDERDFIDDKISSSVLRLEPARLRLAMGPTVKPRGDGQAHSKKPVKSALRIDILYISY